MKKVLIATAITIFTGTVGASAAAFEMEDQGNQLLINKPKIEASDQYFEVLACYGCISTTTGRPRTKYIRGHYRSNGTYVSGYFKS